MDRQTVEQACCDSAAGCGAMKGCVCALLEDAMDEIERLRGLSQERAEPVAWRFYADGQWFTGSTREACHKMLMNAGINAEIHPLYASALPAASGTVQVPKEGK